MKKSTCSPIGLLALGAGGLLAGASSASAETFKWSDWWLPRNYAEHGWGMDMLFVWIFVITMLAFVGVQAGLIAFLIKYRHNPNRKKAHFIHGNTRLEMLWTLIPAVILAALALASKGVWDNYRYPQVPDSDKVQVMVIGEQFLWNVIYPGADGVVGRYLVYPRFSDPRWPDLKRYKGTVGPRDLSKDNVRNAINEWISDSDKDPLGKVYDPKQDGPNPEGKAAGADDDWVRNPGRPLIVPVGKTVEVLLGSKDVLHSFSIPNFRVKLDAVPGLLGKIYFKPERDSLSIQNKAASQLLLTDRLFADAGAKGAAFDTDNVLTVPDPKNENIRYGILDTVVAVVDQRLRAAGVENPTDDQRKAALAQLAADFVAAGMPNVPVVTQTYEIACQELCGVGHTTMKGIVIVIEQDQWQRYITAPRTTATASAQ